MRQKNEKRTLSKIRFTKYVKWSLLPLSIVSILALVLSFDFISYFFFEGTQSPRGELLKVVLTFVAGIIGILVWHNGVKRVRIMEESNLETRFNNAVGYLGSEDPALVLGGIHAMYQIAVKHKNYTKAVHNLFCGYLREKSAKLYEGIGENSGRCPAIIQNLIDYLFKQSDYNIFKDLESDLSFSTLRNVNFSNVNLINCWFDRATLTNCRFVDTILTDCKFYNTTKLTNCEFYDGTVLSECMFWRGVMLTNCKFLRKIKLMNCKFYDGAILLECNFNRATLRECEFFTSKTTKTSLDEFTTISLDDADLDTFTKESLNMTKVIVHEDAK